MRCVLCRSRQVPKPALAHILAHLVQERLQSPAFSKISIDLAVPGSIFTLADERGQLRQLAGRKRFNRIFDFSETHNLRIANMSTEGKRRN